MNDAPKSLAQTFSDNEKKAQRATLISFCIFTLLTASIVFLGIKWKKAEKTVADRNAVLGETNKKLDRLNDTLLSLYDSLKRLNNKLADTNVILTNTVKTIIKQDRILFNPQLADPDKVFLYLQYIDGYEPVLQSVMSALKNKYTPLGAEKMKRTNFRSVIKYFNRSDSAKAVAIRELINSSVSYFQRQKIGISLEKTYAPVGQIEIWLGEVRKQIPDQIIKMSIQQKMLKP